MNFAKTSDHACYPRRSMCGSVCWILLSLVFALLCQETRAAPPPGYALVWEDGFNGSTLNKTNWTIGLKDPGSGHLVPGAAGNGLLNSQYAGYITPDDVVVTGGALKLSNQRRSYTGTNPSGSFSYTSGCVMSMHKVHFNKGYIEWRARFPSGAKVWPALWLIAEDLVWAPEWDCFEYLGYRSDLGYDNMGLHLCYDTYPNQKWASACISNFDANFDCEAWHVYGFEWTPDYARWSIDGAQYRFLANTFGNSWPNKEMYIMMNNGVRSKSPAGSTHWPNTLEVDYVRIYQTAEEWTMVDDCSAQCRYEVGWNQRRGNPGYLNTETYNATPGATAQFRFNGVQARYFGNLKPNLGYAGIYVDGVFVATVDCYAAQAQYGVLLYQTPVLASGSHTMQLVVNRNKNPLSSGYEVVCDAFASRTARPTSTHVASIVCTTTSGTKVKGEVTVTIQTNLGQPVANATVSGTFSGGYNQTVSGVTAADGALILQTTASVKKAGLHYRFCADNVVHSSLTYAPGENVETCDQY